MGRLQTARGGVKAVEAMSSIQLGSDPKTPPAPGKDHRRYSLESFNAKGVRHEIR